MRRSVLCVVLALLTAFPLLASHKRLTDAEMDGFNSAVKSVSTKAEIASPQPRQPDGSAIIYPVSCEICEYDQDGNVVRRGQNWETGFVGETTRYIRDEDGTVRQQIMENEKGELDRRLVMGPFGKTEEEFYQHGLLQGTNTYRYDQDGNLIEWLTFNANGVQTASTTAAFDENGTVIEQFDRGPNNTFRLHFTQSFDPETDVQIFTNFNEDGTARLTFTARENKTTNYWQLPSDKREFGSGCASGPGANRAIPTAPSFARWRLTGMREEGTPRGSSCGMPLSRFRWLLTTSTNSTNVEIGRSVPCGSGLGSQGSGNCTRLIPAHSRTGSNNMIRLVSAGDHSE